MAEKIRGITIELSADVKGITNGLTKVNTKIKSTQSQLKDVNKLLKLDPKNTELLQQKQKLLGDAVKETKDKLKELKEIQSRMDAEGIDKNSAQYQALQREIIATEQDLEKAEKAQADFNAEMQKSAAEAAKAESALGRFKAGLSGVSDKLKAFSEKTAEMAQKTRAMSAAAAGALTAIGGLAYKAAQNADDLNTLAKQTGFTTAELQKMQYASDRIDVSMETITGAAARMTKQLGSNEDKFASLGVATRDVNGNFRSTSDIFFDTVKALSQIQNETERDTVAMDIFGKSANELAGVIDDGGAALKEFGKEAEDAGLIMSQDTLDGLNEVNDEIDRLKAQGTAALAKAGAAALQALQPVLEKVINGIAKVLDYIANLSPETMKVILIVLAAVAAISPLLSLISGLSMALSLLASPVGIVIAVIAALVAIGVVLYKNWDTIKAKAVEMWESIKAEWEEFKTTTKATFEEIGNNLKAKWESIKANVTNTVESIKQGIVDKFNSAKDTVLNVFESIKSGIQEKIDAAKNFVHNAIETIKGFFNFSWSLPHIALPHFSIVGQFSLNPLSVPHIGVEWYKKAYDQPFMFDRPTVVGAMGFGDGNGAEMVYGRDNLLKDIKNAMSSVGDTNPIYITVQSILDGRIVGESVTRYQRERGRAYG